MRISDWSSDVCSSDLQLRRHRGIGCEEFRTGGGGLVDPAEERVAEGQQDLRAPAARTPGNARDDRDNILETAGEEIGILNAVQVLRSHPWIDRKSVV